MTPIICVQDAFASADDFAIGFDVPVDEAVVRERAVAMSGRYVLARDVRLVSFVGITFFILEHPQLLYRLLLHKTAFTVFGIEQLLGASVVVVVLARLLSFASGKVLVIREKAFVRGLLVRGIVVFVRLDG